MIALGIVEIIIALMDIKMPIIIAIVLGIIFIIDEDISVKIVGMGLFTLAAFLASFLGTRVSYEYCFEMLVDENNYSEKRSLVLRGKIAKCIVAIFIRIINRRFLWIIR